MVASKGKLRELHKPGYRLPVHSCMFSGRLATSRRYRDSRGEELGERGSVERSGARDASGGTEGL